MVTRSRKQRACKAKIARCVNKICIKIIVTCKDKRRNSKNYFWQYAVKVTFELFHSSVFIKSEFIYVLFILTIFLNWLYHDKHCGNCSLILLMHCFSSFKITSTV